MEKQHKLKKLITPKKMDDFLLQQEHLKQDKHFSPGVVEFKNTHACTARVVNFFGDVHTEVFSLRVNSNEKEVAVGCSNGEVKVYDIYKGEVLTIGNTSRMSGFPCTSVRWKPVSSSDFVACNCDGTIKWYNRGQETAYGHYERNEVSFLCSDYQAKEEWCLFGTDLNTIEIFDN
jgi:WD40 repeat protein